MFEFLEEMIGKLGIKLVYDFESKLTDYIKEVIKKSKNKDGYDAQIGSSGHYAQIGSSGDNAHIGSSGYYAKIGLSGDDAQIGLSGDYAKIGSSGHYAQIGSSGDNAHIGSSGYYAKIGLSGHYAKIGSSGHYAKIGLSGDYAKIGLSGDYAKIGSSGDYAQIEIDGNNSVGFACGYKSIIKAKKGTWISLCEYGEIDKNIVPIFALSAQIGNKEYTDFAGKELQEDEYYCLSDKKFYPIDISDGLMIKKLQEKNKDNYTIIKGKTLEGKRVYVVKEDKLSAHGETLKEAMDDLIYKKLQNEDIQKIIDEIRKTNKVTKLQYRAITGACKFGVNQFAKEHKIKGDSISLDKLKEILGDSFGADKFWEAIEKGE